MTDAIAPSVDVLAGVNGAGKSSIAGAHLGERRTKHFNPDEVTQRLLSENPGLTLEKANVAAWVQMKRSLESVIDRRRSFGFETTLGGKTITDLLLRAMAADIDVRVWYVGLEGPDLHIARVRARVSRGGHDIPEETIRRRYSMSRLNLIRLLPSLTELRVFDNSEDADPALGAQPKPQLVLHTLRGAVVECDPESVPQWAKPIVGVALRI